MSSFHNGIPSKPVLVDNLGNLSVPVLSSIPDPLTVGTLNATDVNATTVTTDDIVISNPPGLISGSVVTDSTFTANTLVGTRWQIGFDIMSASTLQSFPLEVSVAAGGAVPASGAHLRVILASGLAAGASADITLNNVFSLAYLDPNNAGTLVFCQPLCLTAGVVVHAQVLSITDGVIVLRLTNLGAVPAAISSIVCMVHLKGQTLVS
jgi:hypothetical protein